MQDRTTPPLRLLLVEDDLVSRAFLQAVLESLPAQVDCAASAHEARMLADAHEHALWLIDVNLPDGRGTDLLASLRQRAADTPALAHTADLSPTLASQLRGEGFADVLVKPLGRQALLDAVQAALPAASRASDNLPTWDEQRALSALNGQQSHIKALRDLFMGELPSVRNAISQAMANDDAGQLRQQLHRLQASCGFVGAARLGAAAAQLQQQPDNPGARNRLNQAIQQLLGH